MIAFFALCWFLFVTFIIAAISGWLVNMVFFLKECIGVACDIACQAWIDIEKVFKRKVFNSRFPGHQKDVEDIF